MSLTVGRFGVDVRSGEVQAVDSSGDTWSVSGTTAYADAEEAVTLRQQLLGYVGSPDEAFVPIVWDEQPEMDGYYRVTGASFKARPGTWRSGVADFSVDIERVQGYAAPLIETVIVGALRTSTLALATRRWIGMAPESRSYAEISDAGVLSYRAPDETRQIDGNGSLNIFKLDATTRIIQSYINPRSFYGGAATLRMGSTDRVVVGRQIVNEPRVWTLSNGMFEFRGDQGPSGPVQPPNFQMRGWDNDAGLWSPWVTMSLFAPPTAAGSGFRVGAFHTISVLSNSPEEVVIRLLATLNSDFSPIAVDVALRRGARHVAITINASVANFFYLQVPITTGAAMVGGWQGYRSADLLSFGSPDPSNLTGNNFYRTTTMGGATKVASTRWSLTCGIVPPDEPGQNILDEYFWAGNEKMNVVAR